MIKSDKQIILITGASDGFGKYTATRLAASGATLLLHGRNSQKLGDVVASLRATFPNCTIETFVADFSNLSEVIRMAKQIITKHSHLDRLINNAGIGFGTPGEKREVSANGFELRFAVNYLAPYLLTSRLMPLLKAASGARIINVASLGQMPLDFNNIMLERRYDGTRAYCQSKLALIMATFDWAEELKASHITVNAIHPASYANTGMVREAKVTPQSTVAEGGEPLLALTNDIRFSTSTGQFFDQYTPVRANSQVYDLHARHQLHDLTKRLLRAFIV